MGKKTKRQQPRPKRKKSKSVPSKGVPTLRDMYKGLGKELQRVLRDKENVNNVIQEHIGQIEGIFRRYDTIQLLGSTGLYLIDNVPNMEKFFLVVCKV